jgi:hypothetical protein
MDKLMKLLMTKGIVKLASIVHENGDENENDPTPYAHTHAFVWWEKRLDVTDVRFLDFTVGEEVVHPNIQTKRDITWAKGICLKYHLGHKTKSDGKKYYIAPVKLFQEGVDEWKFEHTQWDAIRAAPTFQEACEWAGVTAKSLADVRSIRNKPVKRKFRSIRNKPVKRKFSEIESDCTNAWIPAPPDWDREDKSLLVVGLPGIGKTNWAIAQFEKPFCLTQVEDLKHIPPGCDGLVFDNIEIAKTKAQNQKLLTDVRGAFTIYYRNTKSRKPKLPAIWTTNNVESCMDLESHEDALKQRVMVWHVDSNMYN